MKRCGECGKEIIRQRLPGGQLASPKKFCSPECWYSFSASWRKKVAKKQCVCGKPIPQNMGPARYKKTNYCSIKCAMNDRYGLHFCYVCGEKAIAKDLCADHYRLKWTGTPEGREYLRLKNQNQKLNLTDSYVKNCGKWPKEVPKEVLQTHRTLIQLKRTLREHK